MQPSSSMKLEGARVGRGVLSQTHSIPMTLSGLRLSYLTLETRRKVDGFFASTEGSAVTDQQTETPLPRKISSGESCFKTQDPFRSASAPNTWPKKRLISCAPLLHSLTRKCVIRHQARIKPQNTFIISLTAGRHRQRSHSAPEP